MTMQEAFSKSAIVTRKCWNNKILMFQANQYEKQEDGTTKVNVNWQPTIEEMNADDWEILDNPLARGFHDNKGQDSS
jgi:hypothetical protein